MVYFSFLIMRRKSIKIFDKLTKNKLSCFFSLDLWRLSNREVPQCEHCPIWTRTIEGQFSFFIFFLFHATCAVLTNFSLHFNNFPTLEIGFLLSTFHLYWYAYIKRIYIWVFHLKKDIHNTMIVSLHNVSIFISSHLSTNRIKKC